MHYRRASPIFRVALLICLCAFAVGPLIMKACSNASNSMNNSDAPSLSTSELLWEKTYGGLGDDRAFCAVPTDNNGFLIVGSSTSFIPGKTTAWIVRVDSDETMVWNKTYQENDGTEFRNALKTTDGFLLVGNTFSQSGDEDAWIVRIDDQGNVLWNKMIGEEKLDKIFSAASAPDGFVFVGLTDSFGNGGSDGWVIKTDMDGKLLWNKTFGGSGDDAFRSIIVTNNRYLIAGYTDSNGNGNYGFWFVKTDENGTLLWSKTYGGPESNKAYALTGAEDGYIVVGDTHSTEKTDVDALIVKTDLDGKLLWIKTYGGDNFDEASTVIRARNGGYVIAGFTFSYGKGQRDIWIFKIDDFGNNVWSRVYGREAFEEAYSVVEMGDNEFVAGGWTNSIGSGSYDYYAVRMKLAASSEFAARDLGYYVLAFLGSTAVVLLGCLYFQLKRQKGKTKL